MAKTTVKIPGTTSPGDPGLPPLHAFLVHFETESGGSLPGLPTTALHGALGHALKREVCVAPDRTACAGCPAEPRCAYPALFDTRVAETTAADPGRPAETGMARPPSGLPPETPRPLALAPETPAFEPGRRELRVAAGDRVAFRLVLVGDALAYARTLEHALGRLGGGGMGEHASGHGRIRLRFAGLEPILLVSRPAPEHTVLRMVTPVRLKVGGKFASSIDARSLVLALVRRARALSSLHGQPWEPPEHPYDLAAGLEMAADLARVSVVRYSSRQGQAMRWEGLIGAMTLRGAGLAALWPLLEFGEWTQIGKGTTFGLGRYRIESPS